MSGSGSRPGKQGQVRIIGGSWRGRKLSFDPVEDLRPTGDRIRETLFNWLVGHVEGAHCADLFAGTGVLGIEALSRGAAHCDFVDSDREAMTQVTAHLQTLDARDRGHCHTGPAQPFLASCGSPYDIVFIDPPFKLDLGTDICTTLAQRRLVRDQGLVYVESDAALPAPQVPPGWQLHRDKKTGGVAYRLYRVEHGDGGL